MQPQTNTVDEIPDRVDTPMPAPDGNALGALIAELGVPPGLEHELAELGDALVERRLLEDMSSMPGMGAMVKSQLADVDQRIADISVRYLRRRDHAVRRHHDRTRHVRRLCAARVVRHRGPARSIAVRSARPATKTAASTADPEPEPPSHRARLALEVSP